MPAQSALNPEQATTAIVYGDTFALYDPAAYDEFIGFFRHRLKANGIDPAVFRGKRCLDAGCGGGRGSMLMAEAGAKEVVGIDLSERNVETCKKWAQHKGLKNTTFRQGVLERLPFEDASFDVVWCNGVLQHIQDPDQGLREIARVLKPGGSLWLYVYGSGGIYWYAVDWVRDLLADVDVKDCIDHLLLMGMPIRRVAEWIDDWFAPQLRRYTAADVTLRLKELGFADAKPLAPGTTYDTSQRRIGASKPELELMGEGDLRYFEQKKGNAAKGNSHPLPDPAGGKGSNFKDSAAVTRFAKALSAVGDAVVRLEGARAPGNPLYRILAARSVHSQVRTQLETPGAFDTTALERHLADLRARLESLRSSAPSGAKR